VRCGHDITNINPTISFLKPLQFQEIVPDMDDSEFMFNEKQSIRDSGRTLKRYGSTCCNSLRNNETLIRHIVEKTDTLQGIALKYGCTVSPRGQSSGEITKSLPTDFVPGQEAPRMPEKVASSWDLYIP